MRNKNFQQRNQSRPYSQRWDQERNRFSDYEARRNTPRYGQAGYNRDFENDQDRSQGYRGNQQYGNDGGYQGQQQDVYGSYSRGDREWNDPYRDERYGGGYAQGRNFDSWGSQPDYTSGSAWPEDTRGYNRRHTRGNDYGSYDSVRDENRSESYRRRDRDDHDRGERDWWDRTTDEVASWFGDDEAERRRRMDRAMGPNRGKGPKGYQRSDDRIREDVSDRFYYDDYLDASEVSIRVEGGEVVLEGTVDSKEAKRRAEDIAEDIPGVKNVENHIKVSHNIPSVGSSDIRTRQDSDEHKRSGWL
ncbi:MAG TPA: BON domain-containing protein [Flavisolibacter sp.]